MVDTLGEGFGYACICVFLSLKQIHTRYTARYTGRNNLLFGVRYPAHKTADKLVYCHEAMHVQLRMQDAGWSSDVERHESDEESDDSATERDADERAAGNLSESAILRLMV